jgi:hypothetical protein
VVADFDTNVVGSNNGNSKDEEYKRNSKKNGMDFCHVTLVIL